MLHLCMLDRFFSFGTQFCSVCVFIVIMFLRDTIKTGSITDKVLMCVSVWGELREMILDKLSATLYIFYVQVAVRGQAIVLSIFLF